MRTKHNVEAIYPLTPLQQGIVSASVKAGSSGDPYFLQSFFKWQGRLDARALHASWSRVVARHQALRSDLRWQREGEPIQVVYREAIPQLERVSWIGIEPEALAARLNAMARRQRSRPFEFERAADLQLSLIEAGPDEHYLSWAYHHASLDGWSIANVLEEVLVAYGAAVSPEAAVGAELPRAPQLGDYFNWLKQAASAGEDAHFAQTLAGFGGFEFPGHGLRERGAPRFAEQSLALSRAESERVRAAAREAKVTLSVYLQAAWALVLRLHSGASDVVFGVTGSGRPAELPGSERMVGTFINTLPVRVELGVKHTVHELIQAQHRRQIELLRFEHASLPRVLARHAPSGSPLFESVVVFENYPLSSALGRAGGDFDVSLVSGVDEERVGRAIVNGGRNNYPVSLIVAPGDELSLVLAYHGSRVGHASATRLLDSLKRVVLGMAEQPGRTTARLLADLGSSDAGEIAANVPAPFVTLSERVARHAAANPGALAVQAGELSLSYGELEAAVERLASELQRRGVGAESRVALVLPRSERFVVALLAVLKAGGVYVPLDPKSPDARLRAVLADAGARLVISDEQARDFGVEQLSVDAGRAGDAPSACALRPESAAYIVYTSGSTGTPKGVVVSHGALLAYVDGLAERLALPAGASRAMVSTVAADLGLTVLFGALASGSPLHLIDEERVFDPDAMAEYLARHRVEVLKIVPSHLAGLLQASRPADVLPRHALLLGGEATSWDLVDRVESSANCRIFNHYGPTETTVGVLTYELPRDGARPDSRTLPLGRALAGAQVHVLDQTTLQRVPAGVPGEIYIGGAQVARGYGGRPDLTADRFIPDPHGAPGARLYRTGDRALCDAEGRVEFLGRADEQVKIRGFRVELGEIRAALLALDAVADALVLVQAGTAGNARLVAYLIARGDSVDARALDGELGSRLPDYMIPAEYVWLERFPLTANGKLDRRALPAPGGGERDAYVAPRTDVERRLATVWQETLKLERVGVHDGFFSIGGDSILALQVVARARKQGLKLTPKQLFEHRTIAELAAVISVADEQPKLPAAAPSVVSAFDFPLAELNRSDLPALGVEANDVEDVYPATSLQDGLFMHSLLAPASGVYHMQYVFDVARELDLDALERAWAKVVERHAILRTSFHARGRSALQVVHRKTPFRCEILDYSDEDEAAQQRRLDALLEEERRTGFELSRPDLFRVRVIRRSPGRYFFVQSHHHVLLDAWCHQITYREFLALYRAYSSQAELALPEPGRFREYVGWLRSRDLERARQFWRAELEGAQCPTPLAFVTTAGDDALTNYRVQNEFLYFDEAETDRIYELAASHELTPNTLTQAAWALVLSWHSGQSDVVFGVTVAGRPPELEDVENTVGLFIQSVPLRVQVEPRRAVAAWLRDLMQKNATLREHEYLPLTDICDAAGLRPNAIFQSLFVFENAPSPDDEGFGVDYLSMRTHTNYPITVVIVPGAKLGLQISYNSDIFSQAEVSVLLQHLRSAIDGLLANMTGKLAAVSALSANEERAIHERNLTRVDHPFELGYVALFEEQVHKTPERVVASCRDRALSYAELNAHANRVAHLLLEAGARRDEVVAVLLERDLELLVSVTGALKAGAPYLPLDPRHPARRIADVLSLSGCRIVVTSGELAALVDEAVSSLPAGSLRVIRLDRAELAGVPDHNPQIPVAPRHLAYAIYTSGSTGVPKGALVEQRGMLNNMLSKIPYLGLGSQDVIAQTAPQCFDISVWQLLIAPLVGARVEIVPDEIAHDAARILQYAAERGITVLELVPSFVRSVLELAEEAQGPLALRWLLPTGEALPAELAQRWLSRFPGVPLVNAYGPAECSDDVALWTLREPPSERLASVPIGLPTDNTQLYVLDRGLRLCPAGAVGELCVAGVGVGRGYLGDPARTAAAFVPNPFALDGGRLYRTGDLARYRPAGEVEFVGRLDHQVKIRGHRIELGEIEARLEELPGVSEAAVLARSDLGASPVLVAYVVPSAGADEPAERLELRERYRAELRKRLPDYMVPDLYVFLPEAPRTSNGKLDRSRLPQPARDDTQREYVAPRDEIEAQLVEIWRALLGVERVGVHDNFYELGGHSLLITQLASRLKQTFGVEVALRRLFEAPSVALTAELIRSAGSSADAGGILQMTSWLDELEAS